MVIVTANQYDGGSAGGDGNLTQLTPYVNATVTRIVSYAYDFRDRRIGMNPPSNDRTAYTLDNLDRITQTIIYTPTFGSTTAMAQSETYYDNRGRIYQQRTYAVNPNTGTLGNYLSTNTWYDESGNVIQQIQQGDGTAFTKSAYNGVGWVTSVYRGYNTTAVNYAQATTPAGDVIMEQTDNTYDEVGNLVSQATSQRLNDATGTGALSYGTQPKARVSYSASWFDGIDRQIGSANYGAIASFTRPSTIPSSSATVLVTLTSFDGAGRINDMTDPMGYVMQTSYDAAGRKTQTVEDSAGLARTTNWTYTLDDLVETMIATNSATGNQITTYTYGTTLSTSDVARNDLLASITYPDFGVVAYTYNRQNEQTTITDQRGTVRTLLYDTLGRITDDCVTTVGSPTDNAVLRISTGYEVRGMVQTIQSYDNATPGSGTLLNGVTLGYNFSRQLGEEDQNHGSGSTPNVVYTYDSGASGGTQTNEMRLATIRYPNFRIITYNYGTSGGINDYLNRVESIQDTTSGTTTLASYTYLGSGTVIRITYPQPSVWLDLWGGTSGTFNGLDLFNRIIDQRWQNSVTGTPVDIDRYQYGYDQNSNRLWKANVVSASASVYLDEGYTYDHLNRLTQMQRGQLSGGVITGTATREMDYTLDPTGNWSAYLTKTAGTTDLNQGRTSNPVNEITNVTASGGTSVWVTPAYDVAGNMTTMPQLTTPTSSFIAVYDAWNRMTQIGDGTYTIGQYQYDGRNRRIVKLTYIAGVLSETRHFYYTSNWQDVEQQVGGVMDQQHVWGVRYVDELICRDEATPFRLYAAQDANFNVTSLVDTSGAAQQYFVYDPYGVDKIYNSTWTAAPDAYTWNSRFTGRSYDSETGMYYCRMRNYHPLIGSFLSRDPIMLAVLYNRYWYAQANPENYLDPSGLREFNFGVGAYELLGGSVDVQIKPEKEKCCDESGNPNTKTKYDVEIKAQVGVGIGGHFSIPVIGQFAIQYRGPQFYGSISGSCESECGGSWKDCCKVCAHVGIQVGQSVTLVSVR